MFENLQVYQKAVDFADRMAAQSEQFPRGYYFLVDQLNRAALSIATNLAEGNGRFTKADRKHFFTIARGSAQECVPLLELALRRRLLLEATHGELKARLEEISKSRRGCSQRAALGRGLQPAQRATVDSGMLREASITCPDRGGNGRYVRLMASYGLYPTGLKSNAWSES